MNQDEIIVENPMPTKFYAALQQRWHADKVEKVQQVDFKNLFTQNTLEPDVNIPTDGSQIVEFLKGKTIFVTGATGFFGKVLVEKLLRSCPAIEKVFILVRSKKGKDMNERIEEIYKDVIFSQLVKQHPKFREKIFGIKGDVSLPNLGLTPTDRQLITETVSLIYHAAATVRFDEKLKMAVAINVKGTKEILDLARDCGKLQSIVHVSTAFAYCPQRFIDEKFYKPPIDTDDVIELVDSTLEKELEKITPNLLGNWPNTYAFTKAIAEHTVQQYGQQLPICVFRPAIVIATYKEPLRGWIDNLYGPTGVIVAAGTGVIRTLHCDKDVNAEIVPVDYVVNALITASYRNTIKMKDEIPIYNYISSVEKPITWETFTVLNNKYGIQLPTTKAVYYYCFTLNKNKYINWLYMLFLHFLPALLVDAGTIVIGQKPKMMKLYKKIHRFMEVISYFSTQEWTFKNNNTQKLWNDLGEDDRRVFAFNMKDFDWDYHSQTHIMGVRVYLVKDGLETLPEARRKWRNLQILHYMITCALIAVFLKLLYSILASMF